MISIIVPVYNAEKQISRCLDSILLQTYADIEVILINDGSRDSSLEICKAYQLEDNRIKIIDIPNGGVSNARNLGIEAAKGDYIGFVDADDYIELEMYSLMLKEIENTHSDIVFCDYFIHEANQTSKLVIEEKTMNKDEIIEKFIPKFISPMSLEGLEQKMYGGSIWKCLFKKSLIKSNEINFNIELKMGEDLVFLIKSLSKSDKVTFVNAPLYHYVISELESVTQRYIKDFENQVDISYIEIEKICTNYNYQRSIELAKIESFYAVILNLCKKDSGFNLWEIYNKVKLYAKENDFKNKIKKFKSNELFCVPKIFRVQLRYDFYFTVIIISYIRKRI